MSESNHFNLLTDPWIPLLRDGKPENVSLRSLLTDPKSDAAEMGHAREDFGFLARVLASAIVQALWPVADHDALDDRLAAPMPPAEYDAVADRFRESFNLLGERGFMQPLGGKGDPKSNDTDKLLLDISSSSRPKLLRHDRRYDALCPACMTLALFGAQYLATGTGSVPTKDLTGDSPKNISKSRIGYESCLRTPNALITMVRAPSARATVWVNVLRGGRRVDHKSPPWSGLELDWDARASTQRRRDLLTVHEGIFWQPRSVICREVEHGRCSVCGRDDRRVAAFGYMIGQAEEILSNSGIFCDPWVPTHEGPKSRCAQETPRDRPVWTGLADMLARTSGDGNASSVDHKPIAAPVVLQALSARSSTISLVVFGQRTKNASLLARFSETFTVTMRDGGDDEILSVLRGRVQQAEESLEVLKRQLKQAWSTSAKTKVAYWPHDAAAAFWRETEAEFFAEKQRLESDDPASVPSRWAERLHAITLGIFDRLTEGAAVDPVRAERVSSARVVLKKSLNKLFGKTARSRKRTAP